MDLWNLIRTLDGRKPPAKLTEPLIRPETPGSPCSDPGSHHGQSRSQRVVPKLRSRVTHSRQQRGRPPIKLEARAAVATCVCGGQRSGPCAPFSKAELDAALAKLKTGKSPGTNGVNNELLKQLSAVGKEHLPALINKSWLTNEVPATWRSAEIVAIPKKGKPPAELSSYRPISLLSTTSKLAERMLQARLQHWLEARERLNANQAGFRRCHSTIDQIGHLTEDIRRL